MLSNWLLVLITVTSIIQSTQIHAFGITNYPNIFFSPTDIINSTWFESGQCRWSRLMSKYWADLLIEIGPWSVTNKTVVPKSGDVHDYLSFAIYHWPDCSKVGNATALTEKEIWDQCEYVVRDGEVNVDATMIQDKEAFKNMTNSIYLSSLAYISTNYNPKYASHINQAIQTWFINEETRMNPNLNYSQVVRGIKNPQQLGRHAGILDTASLSKLVSGVLIMRESGAPEWKMEIDDGLVSWAKKLIGWLESSDNGLKEKASKNNHATFYYNQLCSLYVLIGDNTAATRLLEEFYSNTYLDQIKYEGDQPFESNRTRPYHYSSYNLMGLVTLAKISDYLNLQPSGWDRRTSSNATIQDALNFAMNQDIDEKETNQVKSLNPVIAYIASHFGDPLPQQKYSKFLKSSDPYYKGQPYFSLNANLHDSGIKQGLLETTVNNWVPSQPTSGTPVSDQKMKSGR